MTKLTLIVLFLTACGDLPAPVPEEAADLAPVTLVTPLPFPEGSGNPGGSAGPCVAADCNTPLNKIVEFSNPARQEVRR